MTLRTVGVLDYGSGNLHSVCRALVTRGATVRLGRTGSELGRIDGLVLPGVGAFGACMRQLESVGGDDLVRTQVAADRPLLAICVGHQVLFSTGIEDAQTRAGLGVFPGQVTRLAARRLPHMGWNRLCVEGGPGILHRLEEQRFYFVPSYAAHRSDSNGNSSLPDGAAVAWAEHDGEEFVAAVQWRAITSTQFHPEKSGAAGAGLLRNWLMG